MKNIIKNIGLAACLCATGAFHSCSLEENNPGGFTLEALSTSIEGYETLVNQCYFGMERKMYATAEWMHFTEADTDLWTAQGNETSRGQQWFWFYNSASPNTTYTNNLWNSLYDGIGSCNLAISTAENPPYRTAAERNAKVAEAHFMRAIYYFNAVEQFGGVTMLTEPETTINYAPQRTEPMTIYREVILPDLEFAAQWLPVGDHSATTRPTRKTAMGFLAKAYLQTHAYGTTEYLQKALETAQALITDCEGGGATYNTFMYTDYADVFDETNNFQNKEALWKHRWYSGADGHGSSNGAHLTNRNDEYFLCNVNRFGAREENQETRLTWDGCVVGDFMPTQHLLSLFVQSDGTLDPRFHQSFTTEWNANVAYTWDESSVTNYDKDPSLKGTAFAVGDKAIKIVMPQDADYAAEIAGRRTSKYLLVDYNAVYNDANKNVNEKYNGTENLFRYFYPSLNKHNSSNYYVVNASRQRNANLNAFFIMRMPEVYFIAAEADILVNGGANAMGYINTVRTRAGALPLSGTATIRTVLDERARELCGEGTRYYDLKRTGMFADNSYLLETHPDLGKHFEARFALRPISTTFTATLEGGGSYYQNPGY